jgi:hypothetical protein
MRLVISTIKMSSRLMNNHIIITGSRTCRPKVGWQPNQTLPIASNPFLTYKNFILWPFNGEVASLVI